MNLDTETFAALWYGSAVPRRLPAGFGIVRERWWCRRKTRADYTVRKDLEREVPTSVAALHAEGRTVRQIAAATGIGRNRIARHLKKLGKRPVADSHGRPVKEVPRRVADMHAEGLSVRKIAVATGICRKRIARYLKSTRNTLCTSRQQENSCSTL